MATILTYTPPGEIDGEPEDVRELSIQQLSDGTAQLGELAVKTFIQLRAAGIERDGDGWTESAEFAAIRDALIGFRVVTDAVKRLQQAV